MPAAGEEAIPDVEPEESSLLRFLTCGSVDDGKSTLIGRLLYDSPESQGRPARGACRRTRGSTGRPGATSTSHWSWTASRRSASRGSPSTSRIAPSQRAGAGSSSQTLPGTKQYTRNMATGASTSDLAVILVDARKGLLGQTRRHAHIAALLGIRHVVLAINKVDLVDFSREVYEQISRTTSVRSRLRSTSRRASTHPDQRTLRGQRLGEERADSVVRGGDATRAPGERGRRQPHAGQAVPVAGPVGQSPAPRTSVDSPGRSPRAGSASPTRSSWPRRAARARSEPHRHAWMAICEKPSQATRSPSCSRTKSTFRAAISSCHRRRAPSCPTSSPRTCSGWMKRSSSPAASTCSRAPRRRSRPKSPRSSTRSTSTRSPSSPRRRSA